MVTCAESAAAALQRGIRKLAARQEAGRFSVNREHVRLGERLQHVLALQRLDGRAQIQIGPEQKDI